MMNVLGISFGRKMERCEIMVKEALLGAKECGAQVEFVSTIKMNIGHCTGCGACSKVRDKGGQIRCILKDDYWELEEKVLNADAIIIAAPVYVVGIVGQLKNFIDRFGPAHDRAALLEEQKKRIAEGKTGEELLDARYFKNRYTGYISVGGAVSHNWVSLGLPMMHLFGMSSNMKTAGHIDAYDQGRKANPVLVPRLIEQCHELGRHVAECTKKSYEETAWYGEPGVCPVCHNHLISISPDMSTEIECPLCGIKGTLKISDGKVKILFSEEEQNRARWTVSGTYEHYHEIQGMKQTAIPLLQKNKERLPELLEKYNKFS